MKRKNSKRSYFPSIWTAVALLALAGAGCAEESVQKDLDQKLAAVPPISSRQDLNQREAKMLQNSSLKPDQKAALSKIHDDYVKESTAIEEESRKLRAVLIKDVVAPQENLDEVTAIKKRLSSLEDRRISSLSKAIRDANHELGRWDVGSQGVVDDFIGETYVNAPLFH